jgi:hypothetical protein
MKHIVVFAAAFAFISCNGDFSPNGEYTPKLIVYSVLDGAADTQYVRVYSSFSPDQYVPDAPSPNTEITNAVVRVFDDSSEFIFRDTVIAVKNGNTMTSVRVYMHPAFKPKEKKLYHLSVKSGTMPEATSTATALDPAQIFLMDTKPLAEPLPGKFISYDLYLGKSTGAYLGVMKVEFEVMKNSVWVPLSMEVPLDIVYDGSGKVASRFYPVPILFQALSAVNRYVQANFQTEVYSATINLIKETYQAEYEAKNLKFKRVRFTLVQFDNELFTYYSVANNFPGATTIRLDEPDYSNVRNGFGIFGAIMTQEKVFGIPEDFP